MSKLRRQAPRRYEVESPQVTVGRVSVLDLQRTAPNQSEASASVARRMMCEGKGQKEGERIGNPAHGKPPAAVADQGHAQ